MIKSKNDSDRSKNETPINFRTPKEGPENDFLDSFIEKNPFDFTNSSQSLVLKEPLIDRFYPDLLYLEWDPSRFKNFQNLDIELEKTHFRLLDYLIRKPSVSKTEINFSCSGSVDKYLEDLKSADLINCEDDQISSKNYEEVFPFKKIVAFEAKLKNKKKAYAQARRNRRFAFSSYLLFPNEPKKGNINKRVGSNGLGLIVFQNDQVKVKADPIPSNMTPSYLSWTFIDWIQSLDGN